MGCDAEGRAAFAFLPVDKARYIPGVVLCGIGYAVKIPGDIGDGRAVQFDSLRRAGPAVDVEGRAGRIVGQQTPTDEHFAVVLQNGHDAPAKALQLAGRYPGGKFGVFFPGLFRLHQIGADDAPGGLLCDERSHVVQGGICRTQAAAQVGLSELLYGIVEDIGREICAVAVGEQVAAAFEHPACGLGAQFLVSRAEQVIEVDESGIRVPGGITGPCRIVVRPHHLAIVPCVARGGGADDGRRPLLFRFSGHFFQIPSVGVYRSAFAVCGADSPGLIANAGQRTADAVRRRGLDGHAVAGTELHNDDVAGGKTFLDGRPLALIERAAALHAGYDAGLYLVAVERCGEECPPARAGGRRCRTLAVLVLSGLLSLTSLLTLWALLSMLPLLPLALRSLLIPGGIALELSGLLSLTSLLTLWALLSLLPLLPLALRLGIVPCGFRLHGDISNQYDAVLSGRPAGACARCGSEEHSRRQYGVQEAFPVKILSHIMRC